MDTTKTKTESPLMQWWRHHGDEINDACLAATGSVAGGVGLRRELDAVARGDTAIDDFRLARVIGRLCLDCPDVREVIHRHRHWERSEARR